MSMTQEKMYMNVDDVCAVLGVSKAFAYKIMKGYNEELKEDFWSFLEKYQQNFLPRRFMA